ncbi:hypothetical protein LNP74_33445 [Klebsiella pneumoniae subsp. pneumoniae]|nr:hypothetical protein [Klebsiella pneumoniae subsp. pneumoniae]
MTALPTDLIHSGNLTVNEINRSAGFLINSFDLPGIGIFMGISARFSAYFSILLPGALAGIVPHTFTFIYLVTDLFMERQNESRWFLATRGKYIRS